MDRRRHVIAAIICAVLLMTIFVSSAYIVHEAAHHHDCTGENCPICQFIAQIEQTRRGFGMALLALLFLCFMLAVDHGWRTRAVAEQVPALGTPVGRKIRLND
ncbi:MAG: hypothetical protein IJH25_16020 [Clostridia bacterium]|nr:hypothetical protein [Clostridia bacterium]